MKEHQFDGSMIDVGFDFTSDSPGYWDRFWDGWKDFSDNPIPQTAEGYLEFLEREVEFVGRRSERIGGCLS
ncbi:hypothetical protein IKG28_01285 [Candidatus Saccharibacteria bacterium]|nr:hypothetical protein [Candidatus Saccharibacteria bacterium]